MDSIPSEDSPIIFISGTGSKSAEVSISSNIDFLDLTNSAEFPFQSAKRFGVGWIAHYSLGVFWFSIYSFSTLRGAPPTDSKQYDLLHIAFVPQ